MTRPRGCEKKGSAREGAELDISTFQCLQPSLFNPSSCQNYELLSSPKCSHVALCGSGTFFFGQLVFHLVSGFLLPPCGRPWQSSAHTSCVLQPFPPWSSGQEPHGGGDVIRAHTVPELVCLQSTDPSCSGFLPFPDLLLPALSRVHGSAMTPEKENPGRSHLLTSAGIDGRCCHPGLWDVSPSQ